jgi:hypothetical protein
VEDGKLQLVRDFIVEAITLKKQLESQDNPLQPVPPPPGPPPGPAPQQAAPAPPPQAQAA